MLCLRVHYQRRFPVLQLDSELAKRLYNTEVRLRFACIAVKQRGANIISNDFGIKHDATQFVFETTEEPCCCPVGAVMITASAAGKLPTLHGYLHPHGATEYFAAILGISTDELIEFIDGVDSCDSSMRQNPFFILGRKIAAEFIFNADDKNCDNLT